VRRFTTSTTVCVSYDTVFRHVLFDMGLSDQSFGPISLLHSQLLCPVLPNFPSISQRRRCAILLWHWPRPTPQFSQHSYVFGTCPGLPRAFFQVRSRFHVFFFTAQYQNTSCSSRIWIQPVFDIVLGCPYSLPRIPAPEDILGRADTRPTEHPPKPSTRP